jgi:heat-inducible transcriptional repressor
VKADSDRRLHSIDELEPRARQILRAVVQEYVETGLPVASQTLARQPGIVLSPASVRAVLADLEALGFLGKPHTSAGRVPTDKGYRFYVDVLVRLKPLSGRDKELIDQQFDPGRGLAPTDVLLGDTSRLLHSLSRWAGIVSTPRDEEPLRAIEFVALRENRVLAICVTGAGAVRNRLLHLETPVGQATLDEASRYLTELFSRAPTLGEAREVLARELETERAQADALAARALALGAQALAATEAPDAPPVLVEGQTSLVTEHTLAEDVRQLRRMFQALEEKQRLAALLERAAGARELTLFLGDETGLPGMAGLAVVASPYLRRGDVVGAVGVIGPARMAYQRIIPIVDYTAKALSRSLDEA